MKLYLAAIISLLMTLPCLAQIDQGTRYKKAMAQLNNATNEMTRFYALNKAAQESLNAGKQDDARQYAKELKALMEKYKMDWNYGNAVQDVNIVFGRLALSEGKMDVAKQFLLAAGQSPGSPQMNTFGPNMTLAKALLEKGAKDTVLEYFTLCSKFWTMDDGKLKEWSALVKQGEMPYFGANLLY